MINGAAQPVSWEVTTTHGGSRLSSPEAFPAYYEALRSEASPRVTEQTATLQWGYAYGLRGMVKYPVTDQFNVCTGLHLQQENSHLRLREQVQTGADSSYRLTRTHARVQILSLHLPLQGRYQIPTADSFWKPVVGLGITLEKRLEQRLFLSEQTERYNGTTSETTVSTNNKGPYKVDGLSADGLNITLEAGNRFAVLPSLQGVISLQWRHSLYGEQLYASGLNNSSSVTGPGQLFSSTRQQRIREVYGISLNDWQRTTIVITLGAQF